MAKENIGTIECTVCGFPDAAVRESKNGLAYIMCEDCGNQSFCRSVSCDEKLRARMQPVGSEKKTSNDKPEVKKEDTPKPTPQPKQEEEDSDWYE